MEEETLQHNFETSFNESSPTQYLLVFHFKIKDIRRDQYQIHLSTQKPILLTN